MLEPNLMPFVSGTFVLMIPADTALKLVLPAGCTGPPAALAAHSVDQSSRAHHAPRLLPSLSLRLTLQPPTPQRSGCASSTSPCGEEFFTHFPLAVQPDGFSGQSQGTICIACQCFKCTVVVPRPVRQVVNKHNVK